MAQYKALSTKKLDARIVEEAKSNRIEITELEFISVRHDTSLDRSEEVSRWMNSGIEFAAFTSPNAVAPFENYIQKKAGFPGWRIFCLSGKTSEALSTSFGPLLGKVIERADNAKELAQKILDHRVKEIIFFCGDKRRDELPDILVNAGIRVHEVKVYQTTEVPISVPAEFDAVLFFSPSAVQSFFSVNQLKPTAACFAIGKTTASRIADFTDNRIVTCSSPSQEEMMRAVRSYFEDINCYK